MESAMEESVSETVAVLLATLALPSWFWYHAYKEGTARFRRRIIVECVAANLGSFLAVTTVFGLCVPRYCYMLWKWTPPPGFLRPAVTWLICVLMIAAMVGLWRSVRSQGHTNG